MAVDQDALDHFEPIIAALEARIAALESGVPGQTVKPSQIIEKYPDGTEVIYTRG